MVSEEKLERLRRVPQYSGWSEELVDLWNRSVEVWSRIRYASAEELYESRTGNEKYRRQIENIREEVTDLRGRIERFGWIEQPVDPRFLTNLETRKNLPVTVPEEGISFGDMVSRILQVLEEAEEERIVEVWQDAIYVYTFLSTTKKNEEQRHIEVHLEGKIKPEEKEEIEGKAFKVIREFVKEVNYGFILDKTNVATPQGPVKGNINDEGNPVQGYMYGDIEKGSRESVKLIIELFDYDYGNGVKAFGEARISPPEWWEYRTPTIIRKLRTRESIGTKGRGGGVGVLYGEEQVSLEEF